MASTTLEEAKKCARCSLPGEQVSESPAPTSAGLRPGTLVIMVYCRNEECRWYNTGWPIQVNPDGSVPVIDHSQTEKNYQNLIPDEAQQRFIDSVQRQLDAETQPGGAEVRNPRA
jgi:hypothetical protein